jgi:hypothetical protein
MIIIRPKGMIKAEAKHNTVVADNRVSSNQTGNIYLSISLDFSL